MNGSLIFYNLGQLALTPALMAARMGLGMAGRYPEFSERLSLYRELAPAEPGRPRVWLQAVSVGEVAVAAALAKELFERMPDLLLTVTSSTPKGLEMAHGILGGQARIAAFPLDLPWPVIAAWRKIRPHVYASLETEIWPNLLGWLNYRKVPCLMLNGRLSKRSFPRYKKIKPLVAPALRSFSGLSMITEGDAQRAVALGADPNRVRVDGNAKYAGLDKRADINDAADVARLLNLGQRPMLTAGSVRSGEEAPSLDAYVEVLKERPDTVLALVPRHVESVPHWINELTARGLSWQRYSGLSPESPRKSGAQVVVVDVMGVLFHLYGLARAAFVGGSIAPLGGHNPMECAAWGTPVCFGPNMQDFSEVAGELLASGAGVETKDAGSMARFFLTMLADDEDRRRAGETGRRLVERSSNAARSAVDMIVNNLEKKMTLS